MAERVKNKSRLRFAQFQSVDGVEFWDIVQYPEVPIQTDDIVYVVREYDRLDAMALHFYEDPLLQWVIATANGMELWPSDLNPGETLRIPSPRYVKDVLLKQGRF